MYELIMDCGAVIDYGWICAYRILIFEAKINLKAGKWRYISYKYTHHSTCTYIHINILCFIRYSLSHFYFQIITIGWNLKKFRGQVMYKSWTKNFLIHSSDTQKPGVRDSIIFNSENLFNFCIRHMVL